MNDMTNEELLTEARFAEERGELERARMFRNIALERCRLNAKLEAEAIAEAARRSRVAIVPSADELVA